MLLSNEPLASKLGGKSGAYDPLVLSRTGPNVNCPYGDSPITIALTLYKASNESSRNSSAHEMVVLVIKEALPITCLKYCSDWTGSVGWKAGLCGIAH